MELESYLGVDFECIVVTEVTPNQCKPPQQDLGPYPISLSEGIISSYFMHEVILLQSKLKPPSGTSGTILDQSKNSKQGDQVFFASCVLELRASAGMRWNLSLVNFLTATSSQSTNHVYQNQVSDTSLAGRDHSPKVGRGYANKVENTLCRKLFIIKEIPLEHGADKRTSDRATKNYKSIESSAMATKNGGSTNMAETIVTSCDNWIREKVVYISEGQRLKIEFILPESHSLQHPLRPSSSSPSSQLLVGDYQQSSAYLLKYQAFGCPDPEVVNGSLRRTGYTEATVVCHGSREVHQLTCVADKHWEPTGRIICSATGHQTWTGLSPDLSTLHGVAFILVLGVSLGVVVGCSLLAVTVCIYKRRSCRPQLQSATTTSTHATYAPFFYQQQQHETDKLRTYDQQRHLLQQQQQQFQENYNFEGKNFSQFFLPNKVSSLLDQQSHMHEDFKSPKNLRRNQSSAQTPIVGQTLHQKFLNNNTISSIAASNHPTLLLHQPMTAATSTVAAATQLDITPLLISDSMPTGECYHHYHHHHLHHGSGSQESPQSFTPIHQISDIYGDDSLERVPPLQPGITKDSYPAKNHLMSSKPNISAGSTQFPVLINGDKSTRKILDSFPSQSDHIYEIAG